MAKIIKYANKLITCLGTTDLKKNTLTQKIEKRGCLPKATSVIRFLKWNNLV